MKIENPTLIALTGMPGAGKSTVARTTSRQMCIPTWYIGQPLLDECARRGLPPTYTNRMEMGHQLGLFHEADPLRFISYSHSAMRAIYPYPLPVIFDAVRSFAELEFLKGRNESVFLVAVLLGRAERVRRLANRDHLPSEVIESRDQAEIGISPVNCRRLSVGQVIAIADHYVLSANGNAQNSPPWENLGLFPTTSIQPNSN